MCIRDSPWSAPARYGRGPSTAPSTSDPADADHGAWHLSPSARVRPAPANPAGAAGLTGEVQDGDGPSLLGGERERQGPQCRG
eukprot:2749184-Pyramimonas_sp.AAC.1